MKKLFALCAALSGCVATPGQFCQRDGDCEPPLRCTGTAKVRGVCVYPEAIPDAAPPVDARPVDLRRPDVGRSDADAAAEAAPPVDGADGAAPRDGAADSSDGSLSDVLPADTALTPEIGTTDGLPSPDSPPTAVDAGDAAVDD